MIRVTAHNHAGSGDCGMSLSILYLDTSAQFLLNLSLKAIDRIFFEEYTIYGSTHVVSCGKKRSRIKVVWPRETSTHA